MIENNTLSYIRLSNCCALNEIEKKKKNYKNKNLLMQKNTTVLPSA